ncbi:MAG: hypothetical protein K2X38_00015 [Gemmataceae bacterium]|nr:hypothetical protein [Gemmataceae bacterium]
MLTRKLLSLFVAGCFAAAAWGQAPATPFAGKWSGSWTNSQGAGGASSLELTEDANGNFTAVWDGVALSGARVNANTIELRGRSNDVASYQIGFSI